MGAYADKLSYEERWNVIHYIRSLQAKSLKVKYNHEVNEMNPDFGVPEAMVVVHDTPDDGGAEENHNGEETLEEVDHGEGDHEDEDGDEHGH